MSREHGGETAGAGVRIVGAGVPSQAVPSEIAFRLSVGEAKVLQFAKKHPIAAIAELVWNALDANATRVEVELRRTEMEAISQILVTDNGHGITPERARSSFREYGMTWKAGRTHSEGNVRILHGRMGEGRLFVLALGQEFTWRSAAEVDGKLVGVHITGRTRHPTLWLIEEQDPDRPVPGTTVSIDVPQGHNLRALDRDDAAANLTAKLAFYLKAYPDVHVIFDGKRLDPDDLIDSTYDLVLDLPAEYDCDEPRPRVTFVEWKEKMSERKLLICDANGIARTSIGRNWPDTIVNFTPYLRSDRFSKMSVEDLAVVELSHRGLLDAALKAIHEHLRDRNAQISAEVVQQLKDEGIYPYTDEPATPTGDVERRTFDIVVTVARKALPPKGEARQLSVNLIRTALESNPNDLHTILEKVLALNEEEREHLAKLLARTDLTDVIGAATTVTNRLDFIGALRKLFADEELRAELREVDQLHPMISRNLWLFGEEWTIARTELGLTNVLHAHLSLLGDDVLLESQLDAVRRADGRSGRVDILLFRGIGDDRSTERIIVELKRPTTCVGEEELAQIKSYARAIVDDPQYRGTKCKWRFYLVTYDYAPNILRDIRQKDKPEGLYDDQEEYEVWVKSWGEILDAAERKLSFFQKQLNYEANDDRVTQHLRESYARFIPDALSSNP